MGTAPSQSDLQSSAAPCSTKEESSSGVKGTRTSAEQSPEQAGKLVKKPSGRRLEGTEPQSRLEGSEEQLGEEDSGAQETDLSGEAPSASKDLEVSLEGSKLGLLLLQHVLQVQLYSWSCTALVPSPHMCARSPVWYFRVVLKMAAFSISICFLVDLTSLPIFGAAFLHCFHTWLELVAICMYCACVPYMYYHAKGLTLFCFVWWVGCVCFLGV